MNLLAFDKAGFAGDMIIMFYPATILLACYFVAGVWLKKPWAVFVFAAPCASFFIIWLMALALGYTEIRDWKYKYLPITKETRSALRKDSIGGSSVLQFEMYEIDQAEDADEKKKALQRLAKDLP